MSFTNFSDSSAKDYLISNKLNSFSSISFLFIFKKFFNYLKFICKFSITKAAVINIIMGK